ncbi:hypothetical protein KUTeg_013261 [Tegillarca granosa]|uniref:Papilin n=1 Tax=Tegillarca granosa TaxID=220873 RepID=A0ABQ9EWM7_TEGGR|nr:hypothetical protein KUTeg_013261 [Tegillarca granosa]
MVYAICRLDKSMGSCRKNFTVQWYYNHNKGSCLRFWYGGCDGNQNRFTTEKECLLACRSSSGTGTVDCQADADTGPCRASIPRWYYDSSSGTCSNFTYGGCDGNSNNFETKEACLYACGRRNTNTGTVNCMDDADTGPCRAAIPRWHYVPSTGDCEKFTYGGCDGNSNNFESREACMYTCGRRTGPIRTYYKPGNCPRRSNNSVGTCVEDCRSDVECSGSMKCCSNGCGHTCQMPASDSPYYKAGQCPPLRQGQAGTCAEDCRGDADCAGSQKCCSNGCGHSCMDPASSVVVTANICTLKNDRGPCSNYTIKWYYDTEHGGCKRFWYGSCGGNANRFHTQMECENNCTRPVSAGDVCSLPSVTGPCRASHKRWYYDSAERQCRQFVYGGCRGNANRFMTRAMCEAQCGGRGRLCSDYSYGCCPDGVTVARGPNFEGCPNACQSTTYGCCDDGTSVALGPNQEGCDEGSGDDDNFCEQSVHGCCSDGVTPAQGPNKEGCGEDKGDRDRIFGSSGTLFSFLFILNVAWKVPEVDVATTPSNGSTTPLTADVPGSGMVVVAVMITGSILRLSVRKACKYLAPVPVCQQPKVVGRCRAAVPRYFYNLSTRVCERFIYGGCDGNQNNFETKEQCERTCPVEDFCQLAPEKGSCKSRIRRWYYEPSTGKCREFLYGGCKGNSNNFETRESCERICGDEMEITDETTTVAPREEDVCRMREESGRCRANIPRWFYDYTEGVCKQFTYGGCEGNKNNFETKEQCENFCSRERVCRTYVNPAIQCLAYIKRWKYDPVMRDCSEFVYGGCGGNSNNFGSRDSCVRKCAPERLPSNRTETRLTWRGPCLAAVPRWYHNAESGQCEQFTYGGCRGNHNNFEDLETCQKYCGDSGTIIIPEGSGDDNYTTSIDSEFAYCHLSMDGGNGLAAIPAWYYDHLSGQCRQFYYGGDGGNNNRFESRETCEASCSRDSRQTTPYPYPTDICRQPRSQGNGVGYEIVWFFDQSQNDCGRFVYTGEGGNGNRFATSEECRRRCVSGYVTPAPATTTPRPTYPTETVDIAIQGSSLVQNGETISLTCTASAKANSVSEDITWYKDGVNLNQNIRAYMKIKQTYKNGNLTSVLEIGNAREKDHGVYLCRTADMRNIGQYVSILGFDPVTDVHVTDSPVTTVTDPVVEVEFDVCDEQSSRGPCSDYAVKWFFNRTRNQCQRFWYGGCGGNANRFENEKDCQQTCIYRVQPPVRPGGNDDDLIRGDYTSISGKSGQDVTLYCSFYKPGTNTYVTWYRSGFRIQPDNQFVVSPNGTLIIREITQQDAGSYACRVANGNVLSYTQRFRVTIEVPIGIFPTPKTIIVRPGENAFLHCQAYGSPQPTVSWSRYKNNAVISVSDGRFFVFKNGTLIIYNVREEDKDVYVCVASNGISSPAQRILKLEIRESLRAEIEQTNRQLIAGDRLYLRCKTYGYPTPNVIWEKLGVPLESSGRLTVVGEHLRISNITVDDGGLYTCIASNNEEKAEDSITITISPRDSLNNTCVDKLPLYRCRLIKAAPLCGYTLYSNACCKTCRRDRMMG